MKAALHLVHISIAMTALGLIAEFAIGLRWLTIALCSRSLTTYIAAALLYFARAALIQHWLSHSRAIFPRSPSRALSDIHVAV